MRGLQSFRWPVKLAMLVIALLAVIADARSAPPAAEDAQGDVATHFEQGMAARTGPGRVRRGPRSSPPIDGDEQES